MPEAVSQTVKKGGFDPSKAYAAQEGTTFFNDGREIELLHFVYSHPKLDSIRGSPDRVLDAIDEYARTRKYLMNVGEDKGRIVCDLIAEVKPKTMVELGGYIGYSSILFGAAVRAAGGSRYYSLEMNPEFAAVIMALVDLAGLSDVVKVIIGPSDVSIARLYESGALTHIDLLFLDHYKPAYTTDLKLCEELKLVTPGSILAADNVIKPGNPPYLEYVRRSVGEKRRRLGESTNGGGLPGKTVDQYKDKTGFGQMKLSQSPGNPNLVYESLLVKSFEPTGVPQCERAYENHGTPGAAGMPWPHRLTQHLMAEPFFYSHLPKNVLLLLLSLIFLPTTAIIAITSLILNHVSKMPEQGRFEEAPAPKTILVTGVSMAKGLAIARLLARETPHRIIGADTEPLRFTSPGRYTQSIVKFYRLSSPRPCDSKPYLESLLAVMRKEEVRLWISCSSVVGAVEDGEVMEMAQTEFGKDCFKAVQFDSEIVRRFHEKDTFIEYIRSLELPVPESYRCTSVEEVEILLNQGREEGKRFILKPIGVNDKARGKMMTLLPLDSEEATSSYLAALDISKSTPFLLQEYITGEEYCTHSLVVRGEVKAFVACPSSDMLMHYSAIPPGSALSVKMLEFTTRVAERGGEDFTGHLSFDFLVQGRGEEAMLSPIECNPRTHTAVLLFQHTPEMAHAYLSVFDHNLDSRPKQGKSSSDIVAPATPGYNVYWIGHDLVTLLIIPAVTWIGGIGSIEETKHSLWTFWHHILHWQDGTWASWDPVPFFALYHVYWPVRFVESIVKNRKWSRINVSTTKMFES
ncbi:uncharacterized protein BDW70DRAFT_171087 [Aspergillus foveolatus]|uniref:uncharacterized protein n=1 Tax=Aspergillus foveolatus TaxID=210207 RepID=UPI003CCD47D8